MPTIDALTSSGNPVSTCLVAKNGYSTYPFAGWNSVGPSILSLPLGLIEAPGSQGLLLQPLPSAFLFSVTPFGSFIPLQSSKAEPLHHKSLQKGLVCFSV